MASLRPMVSKPPLWHSGPGCFSRPILGLVVFWAAHSHDRNVSCHSGRQREKNGRAWVERRGGGVCLRGFREQRKPPLWSRDGFGPVRRVHHRGLHWTDRKHSRNLPDAIQKARNMSNSGSVALARSVWDVTLNFATSHSPKVTRRLQRRVRATSRHVEVVGAKTLNPEAFLHRCKTACRTLLEEGTT